MKKVKSAVSEYFFGTDLASKYEKQRSFIREFYGGRQRKTLLALSKLGEGLSMLVTKVTPAVIEAGSVVYAIAKRDATYAVIGITSGELLRAVGHLQNYLQKQGFETQRKIRQTDSHLARTLEDIEEGLRDIEDSNKDRENR